MFDSEKRDERLKKVTKLIGRDNLPESWETSLIDFDIVIAEVENSITDYQLLQI